MSGLPQVLLALLFVVAAVVMAPPQRGPAPVLVVPSARAAASGLDDWPSIRRHVAPRIKAEVELAGFDLGAPVFIRIFKESHELQVFLKDGAAYRHYRTYPICNFSGLLGPKRREGDMQSPEGFYTVTRGQLNANSKFHLAFNLGYPNAFDQANGRTGSALMVHGNCVSIGCYAMTDAAIEEIFFLVDTALANGQRAIPVHAFPFRFKSRSLTGENAEFWGDLRDGYQSFESTGSPPKIGVRDGRYHVVTN